MRALPNASGFSSREAPLLVTDADRSTSFEDAEKFVSLYPMPRFLRGLNLAIFHTWIAGRSIDLEDARVLASRLSLVDRDACRIDNFPILMISGRRAPEAVSGADDGDAANSDGGTTEG